MDDKLCKNNISEEIAHLSKDAFATKINDSNENRPEKDITPLEQFDVDVNAPSAVPERKCYTVEDIQAMLCISRPSVYKLINENLFHTVKVAGKHRISKKSFDKWFDNIE